MDVLKKEDYEEPTCPFCTPGSVTRIPIGRVMEKLDEYLSANDYAGAERHLSYWLTETELCGDERGRLTVLNEQIGLYRKAQRRTESLAAAEAALALADRLGMENTVTAATTMLNAATAYRAFGEPERALPLYTAARAVYEAKLDPTDERLGGLYNNMALTVQALGGYAEARRLYENALAVMVQTEHGEGEMAITFCNLADLTEDESGREAGSDAIRAYLDRALELLLTESLPHDGNYAFICEKCAPTFAYYGYADAAQELAEYAEEIYERA